MELPWLLSLPSTALLRCTFDYNYNKKKSGRGPREDNRMVGNVDLLFTVPMGTKHINGSTMAVVQGTPFFLLLSNKLEAPLCHNNGTRKK